MKLIRNTLLALLVTSLALPAVAQPGPGFRFNQDNTLGWSLMTAQERDAHRAKMLLSKTYNECKAYQDEHHALMEARAKEKGKVLPVPRNNVCDRMQARGLLK